jgi:protein TonB
MYLSYGNRYQAGKDLRGSFPSVAVIVISLLLHAALIALVLDGLSSHVNKPAESLPIAVKVLPAASVDTMPAPLPITSAEPAVEKKHLKPRPVVKPAPKPVSKPVVPAVTPRAPIAQEIKVPSTPSESSAASSSASVQPSPSPALAPPVKTGVSIPASYAAGNRKPVYPSRSRQYEEEGTVILRVLVRDDGTASTIEIKSSSGHALLDESAKTAVRTWRFKPATSDGKPVSEWFLVPIPFKLES